MNIENLTAKEFNIKSEILLNDLDNAASYIRELLSMIGGDERSLCDELFHYPEEAKYCAEHCQNFCNDCVIRYLKHYKKD